MNTENQYMTEEEAKALIKATYMKKLMFARRTYREMKIARKSMMCENQSNPKKIEMFYLHLSIRQRTSKNEYDELDRTSDIRTRVANE